jgi:hypothetical protein
LEPHEIKERFLFALYKKYSFGTAVEFIEMEVFQVSATDFQEKY